VQQIQRSKKPGRFPRSLSDVSLVDFDLVSVEERYVLPEQNEHVVAFSSDGLLLASATDRPQPMVVTRRIMSCGLNETLKFCKHIDLLRI